MASKMQAVKGHFIIRCTPEEAETVGFGVHLDTGLLLIDSISGENISDNKYVYLICGSDMITTYENMKDYVATLTTNDLDTNLELASYIKYMKVLNPKNNNNGPHEKNQSSVNRTDSRVKQSNRRKQ